MPLKWSYFIVILPKITPPNFSLDSPPHMFVLISISLLHSRFSVLSPLIHDSDTMYPLCQFSVIIASFTVCVVYLQYGLFKILILQTAFFKFIVVACKVYFPMVSVIREIQARIKHHATFKTFNRYNTLCWAHTRKYLNNTVGNAKI